MKLYKLSQGSTFENLKHFIYLTNEYGIPSTEFVDDFINQFGKVILNGNFTLNQNQFKQLDILWSDIVKQCEHNNIEYKENYGNIFYKILCQKAIVKIKEDWEESEWSQLNVEDKLKLLKQFLINFDGYKDELIEDEEKQLITCKECADNTDIDTIHVEDSIKITEEISIKDEKVVENYEEMSYNDIINTIEIVKNAVGQNLITLELSDYAKSKKTRIITDKFNNEYIIDTTTGNVILHSDYLDIINDKVFNSFLDTLIAIAITIELHERDTVYLAYKKESFKSKMENFGCTIKNTPVSATVLFDWEDIK